MAIYILNHGCGCGCSGDPCTDISNVVNPSYTSRNKYVQKFKAGFLEFDSPSTPPKVYLTAYYTGSGAGGYCSGDTYTQSITGDIKYDRTNNAIIENTAQLFTVSVVSGVTYYTYNYPDLPAFPLGQASFISIGDPITSNSSGKLFNTIAYYYGSGTCDTGSGSESLIIDNEYTTDQLNAEVDNILNEGYSGSWGGGGATALFEIDPEETTITKQNFQYKFILPTLTGYNNYVVTWNINTTYVNSSSTLYGMSYIWDGVATETGVYDNAILETPGTLVIQDIAGLAKCL
jgi:hypothetical protein